MTSNNSDALRLIYFDFDHSTARQLIIELDRLTRSLHFCFERSPDPAYDEENVDMDSLIVKAAVTCPDLPQFDGFVRALAAAMRETPFSLQDPSQPLFEAMAYDILDIEGTSEGVPPDQLKMRIPSEIVFELLSPYHYSPLFKPLINIPKQWKPDRFWYESDTHGIRQTLMIKFDEETLTIEFDFHQEASRGNSEGDTKAREVRKILRCPNESQMHGMLHALAKAMGESSRYSSAYVLGKFAGKQGGRGYRPAKIPIDRVAEICLKHMPIGLPSEELQIRIPKEIVPELIPLQELETVPISDTWIPLVGV